MSLFWLGLMEPAFSSMRIQKGHHVEWDALLQLWPTGGKKFFDRKRMAWLDRFGVDGFRVDAVASMLYLDYGRKDGEWIPNQLGGNQNLEAIEFIKQFNQSIHEEHPHAISIAEESTAFPQITQPPSVGGLGFDFKWNMGWMHDVLRYFSASQNERPNSHDNLTFGAMYQFSENFVQAFSHDEVVHGKGSLRTNVSWRKCRAFGQSSGFACLAMDLAWKKDALHGLRIRSMAGVGF